MTTPRARVFATILACFAVGSGCGEPAESTTPSEATTPTPTVVDGHTRIAGRLLGHDGQPLAVAEIFVSVAGQPQRVVPVRTDGAFEIDLAEAGWIRARLTGVGHAEHTLEFLADGGTHELEVRLGTYARPDTHESLIGFGAWDGEGARVSFIFSQRDDGTWVAKLTRPTPESGAVPAAEFHYQIADSTSVGRTVNGTQADRYVYDGGGDYFSVIALGDADELEIVWDPRALPPAGREHELRFGDPSTGVARSALLGERLAADLEQALTAARAKIEAGTDREQAFEEAEASLREQLAAAAAAESDPVLRRMLLVAWAESLDRRPSDATRAALADSVVAALEAVGPRDPLWSMYEWALATALYYVDDPKYFATAAAEHPDPAIGAALWISALIIADESGDLERSREAMTALANPRFSEVESLALTKMYDPERPTAPGRPVPDFRLSSIDGKTELSASDLRGKTYVLDFWATWCGPCIAEMPRLHAAYAELNGQAPVDDRRKYEAVADPRVELISISLDHDRKAVDKFRKEQWPMPWAHVVADAATHKQLSKSFGIVGIPMMVLVGPDGTILASSPRLDGGSLGEIASELLD